MAADRERARSQLWGGVALVAGAAAVLVVLATASGPGLTPDSVTYLSGAQQLAGDPARFLSLSGPPGDFDLWPPFYSAAVATVGGVGLAAQDAARALGVAITVAGIVLAFVLVRGVAGPRRAALASAALAVSDGYILLLGGFAMSDGLYLALGMAAVLALTRSLSVEPPRLGLLVAAGGLAGLASLTRVSGVALVAALVVAVVVVVRPGRRVRQCSAVILGLGLVPFGVWSLTRDSSASGGREFVWHPPSAQEVRGGLANVGKWIVPERVIEAVPLLVELAVLVGGVGAIVVLVGWLRARRPWRARRWDPGDVLVLVLSAWAVAHLTLVTLTRVLVDAHISLDQRLLFPTWVAGLLAVIVATREIPMGTDPRRRVAVAAVLGVVGLAWAAQLTADVRAVRRDGLGLAAAGWRDSALLAEVEGGDGHFSNGSDVVYLFGGEVVGGIPGRSNSMTGRSAPGIDAALAEMARDVRAHDGAVYWFEAIERDYLPTLEEVLRATSLRVDERVEDGVVLR